MKDITPAAKGARQTAENKTHRLQRAAVLSRSKTATSIRRELNISKRTLKRYMADPRWQEYGGVQLTLTEKGRPARDTLSETEKQTLAEAAALHNQGRTWAEAAAELGITLDRLNYLLRKDPKKRDHASLSPADTEILQQAQKFHDAGMNWNKIPEELGISYNRLQYLRRKHETLVK